MLWIDNKTIAIGRSFRTNDEGIKQIQSMVQPHGVKVIPVSLPYDQGKEACLHLQSLISMIDNDLAVVYKKLLPVAFVQTLEDKGIRTIDVPEKEYLTMGPNILALSPRKVLTIDKNPITKRMLEKEGCKVYTYKGEDLSLKAEGGATCLTRPIHRV